MLENKRVLQSEGSAIRTLQVPEIFPSRAAARLAHPNRVLDLLRYRPALFLNSSIHQATEIFRDLNGTGQDNRLGRENRHSRIMNDADRTHSSRRQEH